MPLVPSVPAADGTVRTALDRPRRLRERRPGAEALTRDPPTAAGIALSHWRDRPPNTTSLTWVVSPGFAHEVLHYTASITCATVNRDASTASFGYTIPAGFPGLSGLNIVMSVYDGGSPGTNGDTYGHGVGTCGGAVTSYAITSGNLVVH